MRPLNISKYNKEFKYFPFRFFFQNTTQFTRVSIFLICIKIIFDHNFTCVQSLIHLTGLQSLIHLIGVQSLIYVY